jgi:hypothetical protein
MQLAAAMVAACLLAPPLAHTHEGDPAPTATIAGQACPGGGGELHLHAAHVTAAPSCPACAAGPSPTSAPPPHEAPVPSFGCGPVVVRTPAHGAEAPPSHTRSRGPPPLPVA